MWSDEFNDPAGTPPDVSHWTHEIGDGTISVGELSWTEMGCEPEVQRLEQDFLASLGSATTYSVSEDRLDITAPAGVWSFERLTPVPTADLVGTTSGAALAWWSGFSGLAGRRRHR